MTLSDALRMSVKIRRAAWGNSAYYIRAAPEGVEVVGPVGVAHSFSVEDLRAFDWEEFEEEVYLHLSVVEETLYAYHLPADKVALIMAEIMKKTRRRP